MRQSVSSESLPGGLLLVNEAAAFKFGTASAPLLEASVPHFTTSHSTNTNAFSPSFASVEGSSGAILGSDPLGATSHVAGIATTATAFPNNECLDALGCVSKSPSVETTLSPSECVFKPSGHQSSPSCTAFSSPSHFTLTRIGAKHRVRSGFLTGEGGRAVAADLSEFSLCLSRNPPNFQYWPETRSVSCSRRACNRSCTA